MIALKKEEDATFYATGAVIKELRKKNLINFER